MREGASILAAFPLQDSMEVALDDLVNNYITFLFRLTESKAHTLNGIYREEPGLSLDLNSDLHPPSV